MGKGQVSDRARPADAIFDESHSGKMVHGSQCVGEVALIVIARNLVKGERAKGSEIGEYPGHGGIEGGPLPAMQIPLAPTGDRLAAFNPKRANLLPAGTRPGRPRRRTILSTTIPIKTSHQFNSSRCR